MLSFHFAFIAWLPKCNHVIMLISAGELKNTLMQVLARGPRSIEDFKQIAAEEGMSV